MPFVRAHGQIALGIATDMQKSDAASENLSIRRTGYTSPCCLLRRNFGTDLCAARELEHLFKTEERGAHFDWWNPSAQSGGMAGRPNSRVYCSRTCTHAVVLCRTKDTLKGSDAGCLKLVWQL